MVSSQTHDGKVEGSSPGRSGEKFLLQGHLFVLTLISASADVVSEDYSVRFIDYFLRF